MVCGEMGLLFKGKWQSIVFNEAGNDKVQYLIPHKLQ